MFIYFWRTVQHLLMKFFTDNFGITLIVTTLKKVSTHVLPTGGRPFWCILKPISAYVPLFLENSLICSHEILYSYVLGITLMVTTLKKISSSYLPVLGVIFGYFWAHSGMYCSIENYSIFYWEILWRCSSYYSKGRYTEKKFLLMSASAEGHFGVFLAPFWICFSMS